MTDALGLAPITKHIPYFLAMRSAFIIECIARLLRFQKPPRITRRAVFLIGRPTYYSITKARTQLGWQPRVKIQEGVRRSLSWYFSERGLPVPAIQVGAT
jgi:nucleoside-diphosphate-sugar epimerase